MSDLNPSTKGYNSTMGPWPTKFLRLIEKTKFLCISRYGSFYKNTNMKYKWIVSYNMHNKPYVCVSRPPSFVIRIMQAGFSCVSAQRIIGVSDVLHSEFDGFCKFTESSSERK